MRIRQSQTAQAIALIALLSLSFFMLMLGSLQLRTQMRNLSDVSSDNRSWTISQLNSDYSYLLLALRDSTFDGNYQTAEISRESLKNIRQAFDIYYSRLDAVGSVIRKLDFDDQIVDKFQDISRSRDLLAIKIDALVTPNVQEIVDIYIMVQVNKPKIGALASSSLHLATKQVQSIRVKQFITFKRFYASSFILGCLIFVALFLALRQIRLVNKQKRAILLSAVNSANAVEGAFSGVIFLDYEGNILRVNKAAMLIFEFDSKKLVGKNFSKDILSKASQEEFIKYQQISSSNSLRLFALTKKNKEIPIDLSGIWQKDFKGRSVFITYIKDRTNELIAEASIMQSRDTAIEESRIKGELLAFVSHEMRTPLHGIIASLDMIDKNVLSVPDQALFATANECSHLALNKVNQILTQERSYALQENIRPFSPALALQRIVKNLTPLADVRGNKIHINIVGSGSDALFQGLPEAFTNVMQNLIGNAIKFTQDGEISVSIIATLGQTNSIKNLKFDVKDTGIGISVINQQRLLDEDNIFGITPGNDYSSSGLGFQIVKESLAQMGASISLKSTEGQGTHLSFALSLDIALSDAPALTLVVNHDSKEASTELGLRLMFLIVDDNPVNRAVLTEMVNRMNFDAKTAKTGLEAVQIAEQYNFDVILMDINMYGLNGHETTQLIRAGNGPSADCVILGVTAQISNDEDSITSSGMDSILSKPFKAKHLSEVITKHLKLVHESNENQVRIFLEGHDANNLFRQALLDAEHALEIIFSEKHDWDERHHFVHYALGPASFSGIGWLSRRLSTAEIAIQQRNEKALLDCGYQIMRRLKKLGDLHCDAET